MEPVRLQILVPVIPVTLEPLVPPVSVFFVTHMLFFSKFPLFFK